MSTPSTIQFGSLRRFLSIPPLFPTFFIVDVVGERGEKEKTKRSKERKRKGSTNDQGR